MASTLKPIWPISSPSSSMAGPSRSSTNSCRGLGLSRPEFASQLDHRSYSDQALMRVVVWSRHRLLRKLLGQGKTSQHSKCRRTRKARAAISELRGRTIFRMLLPPCNTHSLSG